MFLLDNGAHLVHISRQLNKADIFALQQLRVLYPTLIITAQNISRPAAVIAQANGIDIVTEVIYGVDLMSSVMLPHYSVLPEDEIQNIESKH